MMEFSVTDFEAVGDGNTINTTAIAAGIAAIAKADGGALPPGKYLS